MNKICSKCHIEKHESEFYARRNRACGLMSFCKLCNKKYKSSDKGKISAQKYSSSAKGKASYKRYRQTANGRLSLLKGVYKYSNTPRGRLNNQQKWRRRRESKLKLDIQFTHEDVKRVYEYFNYQCFNCDSLSDLCIDHHRPLSKGHGLSLDNAVLLCRRCNTSKYNKMPEEFYDQNKLKIIECYLTKISS
jgi:hypothetical protein